MLKAKKLFGYRRKILESKQVNTHQAETLLICLVVHGSPSTKKKDASQKCCVRTNFAINEHVSCCRANSHYLFNIKRLVFTLPGNNNNNGRIYLTSGCIFPGLNRDSSASDIHMLLVADS